MSDFEQIAVQSVQSVQSVQARYHTTNAPVYTTSASPFARDRQMLCDIGSLCRG